MTSEPTFSTTPAEFVAEHRRQRMRIQPFHEVQVGVTEAGDLGADQDFARAGIRHADILDLQRLVDFEQNGGLHGHSLYFMFLEPVTLRTAYAAEEQFANLGHADGALAEQMAGDRTLRGAFRELERIARRHAMVDDHARQQQPPRIAAHLVNPPAFPGQRHRAGDMIQQTGRAPGIALIVGFGGDLPRKADGAIGEIAETLAPGLRHIGAVVQAGVQIGGERGIGAVAADRALQRIDRDDVAGAFPDRTEMRVAQQPRGGEFLDVTDAAAHLQRIAADLAGVAGGAEFQGRRQDAQQRRRILAAGLGTIQRIGGEETHRQRLLGRQHDLHQLPPRQRQVDDALAEHHAVSRHRHRVMMRAPHQRGGFDAVGEPRRIDHLGHLHEAAIELADRIGNRAFQLDLARGHRAGAELVLQPNDPVVVLRTVLQPPRHQEQADAARAGAGAFRPRQQHHHFGVGIGAEPFLAMQPPVIAFLHGRRGQRADVGAAFLLGHELAALGQLAHVGLGQAVEIARLQGVAAEIVQELGATVGDVDRAAHAEFGLVEQEREGVLGDDGIFVRPAHDALADRHRVNAELAERGLLQFAIGRMIFDVLGIAPEAVALVQHRRMAVGQPRAFVEIAAGQSAEPIEMRFDMAKQRIGQMQLEQIRQRRIGPVEIHPRGVRRQQARLVGRGCAILLEWLHF